MTHWRSEKLAESSDWMLGSATFTTVMSSSSMKVPRQTAARVHHLGSAPRGGVAGAGWAASEVSWRVTAATLLRDVYGCAHLVRARTLAACRTLRVAAPSRAVATPAG